MTEERGGIYLPRLCQRHEHDLVVAQLRLKPEDTWRAHYVVAQILMFQGLSATERFRRRVGPEGGVAAMNIVLAEIGCPACWNGALYRLVVQLFKKGGFHHAAKVSQNWALDEEWSRWMQSA